MGSVLLFKPDGRYVLPQMIEFSFKSPSGLATLMTTSSSTAQQAIYIKDMRSFVLPIPPMPEQHEIVRRVEAPFALADQIEARLLTAQQQVDKLTPSVLAKAFRGELVPTEAELAERECRSYESADELLQRVRNAAAHPNGKPKAAGSGKA
jgi:type I restriction enzyme, S subunit